PPLRAGYQEEQRVVRLQFDRVGRRRPGHRDEDRTFGRDADERESTAQRGPCPSDQLHDSRVRATVDHHGVPALGDGHDLVPHTLATVSNSFSPMVPAPPTSTMTARSRRSPALSSAAAISSVLAIRMWEAWMSPAWLFIGAPRCCDDPTTGLPISHLRIREGV